MQADGASGPPSVSGSGRFVAFASAATNLVAGDTNANADIFLRDRDTDTDGVFDEPGAVATTRLSVGPGGVEGDQPSTDPKISADGRYVVFLSTASNLVPGGNGLTQVYRADRTTGEVIRISQGLGDAEASSSGSPAVSADGNLVAFHAGTSLGRIYVRDVAASLTTRFDPTFNSTLASLNLHSASISADGTRLSYVALPARFGPITVVVERATGAFLFFGAGEQLELGASGERVVMRQGASSVARQRLDTGASAALRVPVVTPPIRFVASPSTRFVLTEGGHLSDFDLNVTTPLDLVPLGGGFSADDRWLAVATGTATVLPGGADTNGVEDVFVIDLPARFDLDTDALDDRWETLFGVTDPNADPDTDGQTNAQEEAAGTHPNGQVQRFLAEGATGTFFRSHINLANPNPTQSATAVLTFDRGNGVRVRRPIGLPAGSSVRIDVGAVPGLEATDVATTVESDRFIGVQRTMAWGPNRESYGANAEVAAPAPSPTWFLAEGSTVLDFDLFYLLQNPQSSPTEATVRYLLPTGATVTRTHQLAPGSRTTIYVNDVPGLAETDVSAEITATVPIVVERSMYRNWHDQVLGLGHGAMGVTAAAPSWFLAEGATGSWFDLYVLIANPSPTAAVVAARYAKPDGSVVTETYTVRPNSRHSVYVDGIAGLENTAVATTMTSTNGVPIVVERAMYWPGGFFDYYEGHTSPGATSTALSWVAAGAEVQSDIQTFVLIANTDARAGEATITILPDVSVGATPTPTTVTLPPTSRTTVPIAWNGPFAVLVTSSGASPVQLVVETAVYRNTDRGLWATGANALATPVP